MFGLRLKSWMEAHLGRPRQKSGQNQQKHHQRGQKEGVVVGGCSSSAAVSPLTTTTTLVTSGIGIASSSSNDNPHPVTEHTSNPPPEILESSRSNLDSSPSSEFSSSANSTTSPSSSSVQIQSDRGGHTAQLQIQRDHPAKDYVEKVGESHHHQERTTCTRSSTTGSVSNCTSPNILLGSFCNNLSSPDTGYSTDGHSPKGLFPALSFESSGKSTPKSSYTISSLVSSELHLSHDESGFPSRVLLRTSASLPPHSETEGLGQENNLGLGDETNSQVGSSTGNPSLPHARLPHSHSINHPSSDSAYHVSVRANGTVTSMQCNSTKTSSIAQFNEFPAEDQNNESIIMVAPKQLLNKGVSSQNSEGNKNLFDESKKRSNNPFLNNQSESSPCHSDKHLYNHHCRTESLDETTGNSSSLLTASGNRNIRTSFVLVPNSPSIPLCSSNNIGLKNAFSICSPRRERTRIKTNPWISYNPSAGDGNSNANTEEVNNIPGSVIKEKGPSGRGQGDRQRVSEGMEGPTMYEDDLYRCKDKDGRFLGEINNGDVESSRGMDRGGDLSLLYRISTSTSASDSGKGSLDLESFTTNRNSTESSVLLSDSAASTRNSIISHEAEVVGRCNSRSSSCSSRSNHHASFLLQPENKNAEQGESPHQYVASSTPVKGTPKKTVTVQNGSAKSTPTSVKKSTPSRAFSHQIANEIEDQDVTSTSITLPPELITTVSVSVSAQTNVIMVDKETDILSDWANTDEDGEDEIETDRNDEDEEDDEEGGDERVTPTPSSDTDTGGRAIFPNSQSTSSVTDIDFGDSSAATAASVPLSSSRRHYTKNHVNKHSRDTKHLQHNNVDPRTTCYQSVPIQLIPRTREDLHRIQDWSETQKSSDILGLTKSGVMCPTGHALGIPNTNISLSSLYSNATEVGDYNANKPRNSSQSSNAIARGALSFLRKIFKKGSCSSQRTSPGGSDKVKMPRSSKSKDSHLDNIAHITGLRSTLVTADALVSPHPLVGRKQSINGYFLTPTPNAFRRRSGTGTDSSDSNKGSSKHHKPVKTDIIRVPFPPGGPLSPTPNHLHHSSSSTSSSKTTGMCPLIGNNHLQGYSHTNTNSTASSIHSMSTSTSMSTCGESQTRLGEKQYYQNSNRPSSNETNTMGQYPHYSTKSSQPSKLPTVPPSPILHESNNGVSANVIACHPYPEYPESIIQQQRPPSRTPGPSDSPRLQNLQHRINSPSFNNYSPIHRLVVTGGNHLLSRTTTSSPHPSNNNPCASPNFHSESNSSRHLQGVNHSHNNNLSAPFTPNINRGTSSVHTNPTSPLINHHHQSASLSSTHFTSPSPILRNPRYQYITSSNQNSPLLNAPKRKSVPTPSMPTTPLLPNQHQQHHYYHNHNKEGHERQFPNIPPGTRPPISFSTFSPSPLPSRQSSQQSHQSNYNPFSPDPNLNRHHQILELSQNANIINSHQNRACLIGPEFEGSSSPNPNLHPGNGNVINPSNSRNNAISRSQSYQVQAHYYASPVVSTNQQHPQPQQRILPATIMHPTSLNFSEPPLLMKAHLHNQNVRLNNFLMSRQRYQQSLLPQTNANGQTPHRTSERRGCPTTSESIQERIYETVDSEDENDDSEEDNSEEEDEENLDNNVNACASSFYQNSSRDSQGNHLLLAAAINPESQKFGCRSQGLSYKSKTQQSSKSKRSKTTSSPTYEPHGESRARGGMCQPRPPVPMTLFGPNTFLSETETMLLDDREADRKYKRLINEAEALLREISAVKSNQPSAKQRKPNRLPIEYCPQSDPLRRKAYDCYALRKLQQELAGCCASPPVLHRSRMNLQSPSTPTTTPYFLQNLSVAPTMPPMVVVQRNSYLEGDNHNGQF